MEEAVDEKGREEMKDLDLSVLFDAAAEVDFRLWVGYAQGIRLEALVGGDVCSARFAQMAQPATILALRDLLAQCAALLFPGDAWADKDVREWLAAKEAIRSDLCAAGVLEDSD